MTSAHRNLRVLTWNIHGTVGLDRRRDPERIGYWIRHMAPDIAAIQEVDTRHRHPGLPDMHDYLRDQVGKHMHMAWAISGADGDYGQIIASRFPLENLHVHDVSVARREPRKVVEARVLMPTAPLRVLATHLGLQRRERRQQMAWLRDIVLADLSLPVLLMGDFNEWNPWTARRSGLLRLFGAVTNHRTFPSQRPIFALDRILCHPETLFVGSRVVRETTIASDHLPVMAELALPPAVDLRPAEGEARIESPR